MDFHPLNAGAEMWKREIENDAPIDPAEVLLTATLAHLLSFLDENVSGRTLIQAVEFSHQLEKNVEQLARTLLAKQQSGELIEQDEYVVARNLSTSSLALSLRRTLKQLVKVSPDLFKYTQDAILSGKLENAAFSEENKPATIVLPLTDSSSNLPLIELLIRRDVLVKARQRKIVYYFNDFPRYALFLRVKP